MAEAGERARDAEDRPDAGKEANDAAQPALHAEDSGAEPEPELVAEAIAAADKAAGDGEAAVEAVEEDGGGGDELSFDYSGDEMEDADEVNQVLRFCTGLLHAACQKPATA